MSISRDTLLRLITALDSTRAANEMVLSMNTALALAQARSAALDLIHSNGSIPFNADQSLAGHKLTNLANPLSAQDAATKAYVDAQTGGGGADTSLSNLIATAISQNLTPATDLGPILGSASKRWGFSYIAGILDSGGTAILNGIGRSLHNTAGTSLLDFSGTNLSFGGKRLLSVSDPTDPQDAATKAYVDATVVGGVGVNIDRFTLTGTDITNKYVTLSSIPASAISTLLEVIGGISQDYSVDFIVSGNLLSWSGLTLDGVLAVGDKLIVQFI